MPMPLAEALRLVRDDLSTTLEPESLRQLCRDCGHRWRERLLGPVTTIHLFVLQILHGNTACAHLPHLAGMAFTDSAYCQARARLPLGVLQALLRRLVEACRPLTDSVGLWHGHRTWMGDGDTILFVFAGSAAEFALNRAVDWLFFTGKLPADPFGRLFSTARFAQDIAFVDEATALGSLDRIRAAHEAVERSRGMTIPAWAHRDVLYMLIDYSERAFELLHRPLTDPEKADLYDVFRRVGEGLAIPDLPETYGDWQEDRRVHLVRDLIRSDLTDELYGSYRQHLGWWRYETLLRLQSILVPDHVRRLLGREPCRWMKPSLAAYRTIVRLGLRPLAHRLIMPPETLPQVRGLDYAG